MKSTLQSRRFFVQILVVSISLLLALCVMFSVILFVNTRNSTSTAIFQSETERNQDLMRQSNLYWNQLINVGTSISGMYIPYDELRLENYWTRTVFEKMIASHKLSNNYTGNIDTVIDGHSSSPTRVSHDRYLGSFSFYDIYTQETPGWPYPFDLVTKEVANHNQVTITVNAYYLSEQLFPSNEEARLDILLTADGTILLSNSHKLLFQTLETAFPNFLPQESHEESLPTYEDYYYTLTQSNKYGFSILSFVPKSLYAEQYLSAGLHTALMAGCLILLGLGISIFLTTRFYNPVNQMVKLLLTYIPEDIREYENEIAFIHHHIEAYLKKDRKDRNVNDNFSQIQNAQAAVLQHQINSHFLFNTLENIKAVSIAELGIDNEIESSIIMLNSIIREGIFHKNAIVSLAHEIHLSKCYLDLMHLRFPDVYIQWEIDDELLNCQVFKFSMQPILENCFTHGLRGDIGRPKKIWIQIVRESATLLIRIRDNGKGFPAEATPNRSFLFPQLDSPSHQVGIKNIHKRITGLFGEGYGITLHQEKPGILVEIRYPMANEPTE